MRRTKIFYFIPHLQQGGTERQILELIARLPAQFEPVLCVYHDRGVFYDAKCPPGQPAHSLGVERMGLSALRRLTDILRQERPDIVHSFRDKANFWARLAARRAGVPVTITSCRNRMMHPRYVVFEWFFSRWSRLVLTNSVGVKQELVRYARLDPDRVRVIYNILDTDHFRPPSADERAEARARWDLPDDARVLLLPGRVGLQKHQIGFLLALRALARRGRLPARTVVLFAGRDRDLAAGWLARRLARRLGDVVRFVGPQKDIRSLYWASDALVMPSLFEGLANAALEGVACGLPALLSHAANVDLVVRPGETGWEAATGRLGPLAAALGELLAVSDDRLREMGRLGREHVLQRFGPRPSRVVEQMVAVYEEVLRDGSDAAAGRALPPAAPAEADAVPVPEGPGPRPPRRRPGGGRPPPAPPRGSSELPATCYCGIPALAAGAGRRRANALSPELARPKRFLAVNSGCCRMNS